MQLTRATERRTAVVAQARRKLSLALGVAGTVGGTVLLGANVPPRREVGSVTVPVRTITRAEAP